GALPKSVAEFTGKRSGAGFWMHGAPYWLASRTPSHPAGDCGGFHRRSPTGGAAKGIPLNTVTPSTLLDTPCTRPCCVRTGWVIAMTTGASGVLTALPLTVTVL